MIDYKPAKTSIVANHGLQIIKEEKLADKGKYKKIIGKLIYLSHTRPNIAYAVGIVSRFMHMPQTQHMNVFISILRYLKGTIGRGIVLRKNGHLDLIIAYADANWAGD